MKIPTGLIIETSRLCLHPFTSADLAAFLAYRNEDEVARYQGWSLPYTVEQAQAFFQQQQNLPLIAPGEWRQLLIERKADGQALGDVAFKLSQDSRQAEIGCTLSRLYWGEGYAYEAGCGLLQYLFAELGLHRVYANCDVENLPAAHTLERFGLRREAHFVENLWFKGRWSSEYWYAILAKEWQEMHAAHPPQ